MALVWEFPSYSSAKTLARRMIARQNSALLDHGWLAMGHGAVVNKMGVFNLGAGIRL